MTLESRGVRYLTVTQDGETVWHGLMTSKASHLSLPARLTGGRARLLLDSPGPSSDGQARAPEVFALADLNVEAGVR